MTAETDDRPVTPVARPPESDGHGQAAILLVESLIHNLIARSVLSVADAVDLVAVAMDARREISFDQGEYDDARDRPLALLSSILASLQVDERSDAKE